MASTRNTSRSHANPSRMQDQPGGVNSRPLGGTVETVQANTEEVEALPLTNQRLIKELAQLTRQMQRPQEARQAHEGHNTTPQEEQPHLGPPREAEAKSSRARGHGPHLASREERNEAIPEGDLGNDEPTPSQQRMEEQSWEQRFKGVQQELNHMKEVLKGRSPDSMNTLVQQTESPFTAEVLHFPLPTKFRMPQIEAFDGGKDHVDHLNTYKNQMELHGYQNPIRC